MNTTTLHDHSKVRIQKRPSLKLNALSNWVALSVNIMIGFVLTPVIVKHLGQTRFGMWTLASSLVGYFGLVKMGVGTGVLRYVPMYRGKGDKEKVDVTISTGMAFYTGVGLAIFMLCWLFADSIAAFFRADTEFATLVRITGLAVALECPTQILDTAIRSYESFVYVNVVAIAGALVRAVLLAGCILMGYGLVAMGWVWVITAVFLFAATGLVFRKCCWDVTLGVKAVRWTELKMLLYFGVFIIMGTVAELLTYDSPKQIIGKVISLPAVGFFGIAALLVSYYRQAIYSLTRVFLPRFSYLAGSNSDKEIRRLFFAGSKYTTILLAGVALLIFTVGPSFLRLWLDKSFGQAAPALIILTAGSMVFLSHNMSINLLYGLGKEAYIGVIAIIEGIAVFGLCLALSFKYGITGVAIGVAVPLIVIRGFFQTRYVCGLIKVSFRNYYAKCILRPWIVSIAIAVSASFLIDVNQYIGGWVSFLLVSAIVTLVYGTVTYLAVIESSDKKQINSWLLGILGLAPANR